MVCRKEKDLFHSSLKTKNYFRSIKIMKIEKFYQYLGDGGGSKKFEAPKYCNVVEQVTPLALYEVLSKKQTNKKQQFSVHNENPSHLSL